MLGVDDIQGKKHGFLAGNQVYYVSAVYLVQVLHENETIGLPHPFHNDLRARGTAYACHASVGCGNDYSGWEFYRGTKIAYGTVVAYGLRWEHPAPARMYWRPDKIIVEYELSSPYLRGEYAGWCPNWRGGSSTGGRSFFAGVTREQCWDRCRLDSGCQQAVWEGGNDVARPQCWLGLNSMPVGIALRPSRSSCVAPGCEDRCFAKGYEVPAINIREEKFINANDVVSTTITSDVPVALELAGNSWDGGHLARNVVSLDGSCSIDAANNVIHVVESGVMVARVAEDGNHRTGHGYIYMNGTLMYEGMSMILGSSRPMTNAIIGEGSRSGVCTYQFTVPLDSQGTTISWAMHDERSIALANVLELRANPPAQLQAKTDRMNGLLNDVVPYFRCSDHDIVKVYYFLWSIFLMYYKQGDRDMGIHPHTQSAVHNFLGMHRFDAVFQIIVGSWASPAVHDFYANGNVLAWNLTLPFRQGDWLPDNFGLTWTSNLYGPEVIAHVIGAWQIYEHSGNTTFLAHAYQFYKALFWDGIRGMHFGYGYDSILCLNKMAAVLGTPEDAVHWNRTARMDNLPNWLNSNWERAAPNFFGGNPNNPRVEWGGVAVHALSMYPREWALATAQTWLDDSTIGLSYGDVPLSCIARQNWRQPYHPSIGADYNFAYTPDANWYLLRGLYMQSIDALANKFTLGHLKHYNMEWGIPMAPEARRMDGSMHGDSYSNFNAGKILLILEGIGGLKYSTVDDTFTFKDSLPTNWTFMEFQVPVVRSEGAEVSWVTARSERRQEGNEIVKTVSVTGNPFSNLVVEPWAEDLTVLTRSSGSVADAPVGHVGWRFSGADNATVVLTMVAPVANNSSPDVDTTVTSGMQQAFDLLDTPTGVALLATFITLAVLCTISQIILCSCLCALLCRKHGEGPHDPRAEARKKWSMVVEQTKSIRPGASLVSVSRQLSQTFSHGDVFGSRLTSRPRHSAVVDMDAPTTQSGIDVPGIDVADDPDLATRGEAEDGENALIASCRLPPPPEPVERASSTPTTNTWLKAQRLGPAASWMGRRPRANYSGVELQNGSQSSSSSCQVQPITEKADLPTVTSI